VAVSRFLKPRHAASRSRLVSAIPTHNVIGVGIGTRHMGHRKVPAILLYVRNKLARRHVAASEMLPRTIAGVPTDVIEAGTPRFTSRPGDAVIVPLGGMDNLGTFGGVVTDADGNRYILSNNHVLANINANAVGTPVFSDGDIKIASLTAFVPLSTTKANLTDAAVAVIVPGASIINAATGGHIWTSSVPATPYQDAKVFKTGAASGYREGKIMAALSSKRVEDEFGRSLLMSDCFVISDQAEPFCVAGDSGSIVVDAQNRQAVGLIVGRAKSSSGVAYTIACPLAKTLSLIRARMGVSSLTLST
jgi:hypothetical protein